MKTFRTHSLSFITTLILCAGMILLPGCNKDEDEDAMDQGDPCAQLACQNGGNAVKDIEFDTCRCICPAGFSGANCEIKDPE